MTSWLIALTALAVIQFVGLFTLLAGYIHCSKKVEDLEARNEYFASAIREIRFPSTGPW